MTVKIKNVEKLKVATTGSVYNEYNSLIKKIEANLSSKKINIPNYDGKVVKERLIQRIVELTCDSYTQKVLENERKQHKVSFKFFNLNGIKISSENGEIYISLKIYFFNLLLFVIHWVLNFKCIIISFFRNSLTTSLPSTILMEAGGDYINSDKNLVDFCKCGPIVYLRDASHIIIKSKLKPKQTTNSNIEYENDPLHKVLCHRLSLQDKLAVFIILLRAPFFFIKIFFRYPICILIAKDFVNLLLVKWLDERKLIESINITTSSLRSQPLWFRRRNKNFTTNMIWYSQNLIPKIYKDEKFKADLPFAIHMKVDNHSVWTKGFKKYLESIGQKSEINVVGPLLWYLPNENVIPKTENLKIVLFDIIPYPNENRNAKFREYYTTTLMKKFVSDVLQTCQMLEKKFNVKIFIDIKHKRDLKKKQDKSYFDFLDELIFKNKRFSTIDANVNLYTILETTDLSISVPYTSTAYISSELKKDALYYDPFGDLIPTFEKTKFISFASNILDLEKSICQSLNLN